MEPPRTDPEPRLTLPVTAGGTLLALLVFTAPLSVVPSVATGVHAGTVGTSWILSSMSLGLAVAMLISGAIGDDFGRRRVFVLGAVVLAAGSVLCGLAPVALVFVLGRVLEGIGAAAVIACGLAVIGHSFPAGPRRAHATGMWGACVGAGIAVGPLIGSVSDVTVGWRATYAVIVVLSVLLAVAGHRCLAESRSGRARKLDLVGSLLLGTGLGALLAALTEGRQGWTSPLELSLAALAVVLLVAFVVHQRRASGAMLDLSLFTRPALLSATLSAFVAGAGVIALMSFMSTVLERGMGRSPVTAALVLLAWSATSVVSALLTRRIPARFSGGGRMSLGFLVTAIGLLTLTLLAPRSQLWWVLAGLLVAGVGSGVVNATLGREAVASVPAHRAGMGSGINNTSRYVGAAIGVTVVTVIAVRPSPQSAADLMLGWNVAAVVGIGITLAGALGVLLLRRAELRLPAGPVTTDDPATAAPVPR